MTQRASFPPALDRFPLATLPTPLVRAKRLEARLGGPPLYVKRDDLTGFAAAGHKARPLEFLVGAAVAGGCDVLVTGGGPGSNFCAAAAAAAGAAGLRCELVFYGDRSERNHPNLALALACGAGVRYTGDPERTPVDTAVTGLAAELRTAGHRPYAIPRGGATAVGALGMMVAAGELAEQLAAASVDAGVVVIASGSGTTCAGLALGTDLYGGGWRVVGASVSRPVDRAGAEITRLATEAAALAGAKAPAMESLDLVDARGPGFAIPSEAGERAASLALGSEGLLLDPVYTAKAFAVVLELVERGADRPIVFWHTGGLLSAAEHLAAG
ncbi:MAG TPA: pyridoxal-phosphate dependent enzyme [Acidimicrobiales bacterium]|nr:pyridoxal-phosphate dependent enzyme [Acidimicrobiales bacterium]